MTNIKAIIFDCGGVFLHHPNLELITLHDIATTCRLSYEKTERIVTDLLPDLQRGTCDEETFWERFRFCAGLITLPEGYLTLWTRKYLELSRTDTETLSLVEELHHSGYKTPVLSNTIPPHMRVNRERNLFKLFEPEIFSCDVGWRKPEAEIYCIALERSGVAAAEAIFIDDVPGYVAAAEALGIDGILFQNAQQVRQELQEKHIIA